MKDETGGPDASKNGDEPSEIGAPSTHTGLPASQEKNEDAKERASFAPAAPTPHFSTGTSSVQPDNNAADTAASGTPNGRSHPPNIVTDEHRIDSSGRAFLALAILTALGGIAYIAIWDAIETFADRVVIAGFAILFVMAVLGTVTILSGYRSLWVGVVLSAASFAILATATWQATHCKIWGCTPAPPLPTVSEVVEFELQPAIKAGLASLTPNPTFAQLAFRMLAPAIHTGVERAAVAPLAVTHWIYLEDLSAHEEWPPEWGLPQKEIRESVGDISKHPTIKYDGDIYTCRGDSTPAFPVDDDPCDAPTHHEGQVTLLQLDLQRTSAEIRVTLP